MRSPPLALVALALAAATLAPPLGSSVTADPDPDGLGAVLEVQNFAMTYPFRFGDLLPMQNARTYLVDKLTALGLEVETHRYNRNGAVGTNILGILRGEERPHDWVVVSAHYDTVMTPWSGTGATANGAWDDGAGVAAALEIARVAAQRPWNNSLVFAFFDDEEGGLIGSAAFVRDYDGKAWADGAIRLTANLNMDPPGLNWPCVVDGGAYLPVTLWESHAYGAGQALLRGWTLDARDARGVPPAAQQFFSGGSVQVGILAGASDNRRFGEKGIPEMYVGSSTHLFLAPSVGVRTMFPLHTPADTLEGMIAYCGGNVLTLAEAFSVEMDIVYDVAKRVDAYGAPFPRP